MTGSSRGYAAMAAAQIILLLAADDVVGSAAAAAATFVAPFSGGLDRDRRSCSTFSGSRSCNMRAQPLAIPMTGTGASVPKSSRAVLFAAAASSVGEDKSIVDAVSEIEGVSNYTDSYYIDETLLADQMEEIALGQLTQDNKRNMLTVMRQLSSMGRRRDDIIPASDASNKDGSYTRQRRQDATIVERLLDRLMKEYHHLDNNGSRPRTNNLQDVNAKTTYNLAIKAWANANVRGSAEKAERVLKKLKVANINGSEGGRRGKGSGSPQPLQPDLYSFAWCYEAWFKEATFAANNIGNAKASASAMRKAESVLQSMKQTLMRGGTSPAQPSSPLNMAEEVNSLLVMWSNTNPNLPDLLETFLRFISVESRAASDTWLNARSYNLVINGEFEECGAVSAVRSQLCSAKLFNLISQLGPKAEATKPLAEQRRC